MGKKPKNVFLFILWMICSTSLTAQAVSTAPEKGPYTKQESVLFNTAGNNTYYSGETAYKKPDHHYIFFKSENSGRMIYSIEDEKESRYYITIQEIAPATKLSKWNDLITTSNRVSEIGRRVGAADIVSGKEYILILTANDNCKYNLKIVLLEHQYPLSTFSEAFSARHQRAEWTSNRHKTTAYFVKLEKPYHFDTSKNAIVLFDGNRTESVEYTGFDQLNLNSSQVVTVYYRCSSNGRFILENIEVNGNYFIVGKEYRLVENLRLRSEPLLNSGTLQILPVNESVIIIQEGKIATIDNITSAWVKVKSQKTGNTGWCFGGYLKP